MSGPNNRRIFLVARMAHIALLLPLAISVTSIACSADMQKEKPAPSDSAAPKLVAGGGQIIVKFREPGIDPSRPEFLTSLSGTAGTEISFVRPMSGGAFVLRASGVGTPDGLADVVRRLKARPDVESAEPDRLLHPMRSPKSP